MDPSRISPRGQAALVSALLICVLSMIILLKRGMATQPPAATKVRDTADPLLQMLRLQTAGDPAWMALRLPAAEQHLASIALEKSRLLIVTQPQQALKAVEEALQSQPLQAELHLRRLQLLLSMGQPQQALTAWQALPMAEHEPSFWCIPAAALANEEQARKWLDRLRRDRPALASTLPQQDWIPEARQLLLRRWMEGSP